MSQPVRNADELPAVGSLVERPVRPVAEARWYCLDRDGVAMLCKDEADARAQVIENDDCWPGRAPHRAALLGDVAAERERCGRAYGSREVAMTTEIARLRERVLELEADPQGGDVIPLAETRCGDLRRSAERCITAWTVVRGGVWDPNGLMDEHMAALRKALGPNIAVRHRLQTDHVAWCRYIHRHEKPTRIVLCDSDAPGAFPVYRHPQTEGT